MASCRCTDINNLEDDINVLASISMKMCTLPAKSAELASNCDLAMSKELDLYEADYRLDVSERIGKLDDALPQKISDALTVISNKLKDLSNQKVALEAEDKEYHDEQKRLEEEKRQNEIELEEG